MATFEEVPDASNIYVFRADGYEARRREQAASVSARAEALFHQGLAAEESGHQDAALVLYQRAVNLNSGASGAWVNMGTIWFNRTNRVEAERCYRRALDADPDYALAHFNLGNLYDGMHGGDDLAFCFYQNALELNARYGDAHFNMALLHERRGNLVEAIYHFREFLKWGSGYCSMNAAAREIMKLREELRERFPVLSMPAGSEKQGARRGRKSLLKGETA